MSETADAKPVAQPRFVRILLATGLVTLLVLVAVGSILGRQVAEKIATALAMPCGILWYLLTCCLILAAASRQRRIAAAFFCAWLAYSIFGSGFFACMMARSIESPFAGIDPLQQKPFDVVVVLGGGGGKAVNQRLQGNTSGDRIILAAQLYHAGIAPKLICTGKRITRMEGAGPDPSEVSMSLLTDLGVPKSAIERLGGHNTSEEMRALGERFRDHGRSLGPDHVRMASAARPATGEKQWP